MPDQNQPSHGDILFQIGEVKGQLSSLFMIVAQKREDLNGAFARIGTLERCSIEPQKMQTVEASIGDLKNTMARWCGFALACSFVVPILITAAKPLLHFGEPRQPPTQRVSQ